MSTYTQILYQIVFGSYKHENTLTALNLPELHKYIAGVVKNKKCKLYQIGGVENHIHIITHLHPSVSLASLVKDIKLASSDYIKRNSLFPSFQGWQNGYSAFTYTTKELNSLVRYVQNQENHHKKNSFRDELRELLKEHNVDFDEAYL